MTYFTFDRSTQSVEIIDTKVLLIKEFRALLSPERNKTKTDPSGENQELAQKEFTYMYLYLD
jgi:phage-related protein